MAAIPQIKPGETKVGWIGTGVMGSSMAGHLLKAGFPLTTYSRTKSKAEPLLAQGANGPTRHGPSRPRPM